MCTYAIFCFPYLQPFYLFLSLPHYKHSNCGDGVKIISCWLENGLNKFLFPHTQGVRELFQMKIKISSQNLHFYLFY